MIEGQAFSVGQGNEVRIQRRVGDVTVTVIVEQAVPSSDNYGRPLPPPRIGAAPTPDWNYLAALVIEVTQMLVKAVSHCPNGNRIDAVDGEIVTSKLADCSVPSSRIGHAE